MSDSPKVRLPAIPGSLRNWKKMIEELNLRPSKGKGQNFLFDRNLVQKIVRTAGIGPDDHVVEIGPGLGILTWELLVTGAKVTSIELDWRLAQHLTKFFAEVEQFRLIEGDALTVDLSEALPKTPYKLVANLPYSVGTAIIQRFLEAEHRPESMTVMVQKEVGERLVSHPPDMSILAVATSFLSEPKMEFIVPPAVFYPPPRVDSAVVSMRTRETALPQEQWPQFFSIVHAGFSQKRKNLGNSISHRLELEKPAVLAWLEASGIDPMRRAETLSVEEWVTLTRTDIRVAD